MPSQTDISDQIQRVGIFLLVLLQRRRPRMYYCNHKPSVEQSVTSESLDVDYERSTPGKGCQRSSYYSCSVTSDLIVRRPAARKPLLSRRHDALLAPQRLSTLHRPSPPPQHSSPITVVNVYKDNEGRFSPAQPKCHAHRFSTHERDKIVIGEKAVRYANEGEAKVSCLVTDSQREHSIPEKNVLPRWEKCHRRNRCRLAENASYKQYNNALAYQAWTDFVENKHMPQEEPEVVVEMNCKGGESRRHRVTVSEAKNRPCMKQKPLYGSEEAERYASNAIGSLLLAEKDIQCLQFVTGPIYPQSKEILENINAMVDDLKLFNTHYKQLKKDTATVLGTKAGHKFTVTLKPAPRDEMPFPK